MARSVGDRLLLLAVGAASRSAASFARWPQSSKIDTIIAAAREAYQASRLAAFGSGSTIDSPVTIYQPEMVRIGSRSVLNAYVHIWGGGGVTIGDRVMVGSHTAITSVTHDPSAEDMTASVLDAPIVIEDDVWIGTHAVILPGVTIGRGAIIGAGCVVTDDVPPRAIVVGVPGRVLRMRPE